MNRLLEANMDDPTVTIESGVATLTEALWAEARRRHNVIGPLAKWI